MGRLSRMQLVHTDTHTHTYCPIFRSTIEPRGCIEERSIKNQKSSMRSSMDHHPYSDGITSYLSRSDHARIDGYDCSCHFLALSYPPEERVLGKKGSMVLLRVSCDFFRFFFQKLRALNESIERGTHYHRSRSGEYSITSKG